MMAGPNITLERLREIVSYSPETGAFNRLHPVAKPLLSNPDKDGYLLAKIEGKTYRLSRLAWFHFYGSWPSGQIDHKNGNKQDNRIANLRDVDQVTNRQNLRSASKSNASGFLGVRKAFRAGGWQARITVNGKLISLGVFGSPELAHSAYVAAKRDMHAGSTI